MSKNVIYTGIGLFNILTPNKNVSLTFSGGNTVIEVLDHALSSGRTPGALATIGAIIENRIYRLTVNGFIATADIKARLWAGHTRSSGNSLAVHSLPVGTSGTISGDFASSHSGTAEVGVLITGAHKGDRFTLVSLILQEIDTDYITPFSENKAAPTFEFVNIVSDLVVAGVGLGLGLGTALIKAIIATDASLSSEVSAIIATDASLINDITEITSDLALIDVSDLIAADTTIRNEFTGLIATDSYLWNRMFGLFTALGDDSATVSDLTLQLGPISSDINAIWATDQVVFSRISALQLTDTALNGLINAISTTDIFFTRYLDGLTATDAHLISLTASVGPLQTSISSDLGRLSSLITQAWVSDANTAALINSTISSLTNEDARMISDISALIATDLFLTTTISTIISNNASMNSDIAYLWELQTRIRLGGSSDIVALQTTDTYLCSVLSDVIASDAQLIARLSGVINSDTAMLLGLTEFGSDVARIWETTTMISTIGSEISAIWATDTYNQERSLIQSSDISAIWATDTYLNSRVSLVGSEFSTIPSLVLPSTSNTHASDVHAIMVTDTYISNAIIGIWTTDAYILAATGPGQTTSDLAAFRTTDAAIASLISGIWATDATLITDVVGLMATVADTTGNFDYLNSEYAWLTTYTMPIYSATTTYTTGQKVFYNGRPFQATTDVIGTQPIDYLFYDDFSYFCDSTPLTGGLYGYESTDNFNSDFLILGHTVSTSSNSAIVSTSTAKAFTIDPGASTTYVDLVFSILPLYASDQPWICIRTAANGPLSFQAGNASAPVGATTIYTIGAKGGVLTGGASASAVISGSSYTPPVSGDTLRIGRSSTEVTLQVKHLGSFGGTATITLTGATFVSASTTISIGMGLSGTLSYTLNSIASYINAATEDAKPWALIAQPISRQHVVANALTLHARYGKFFWSPGTLIARATTTDMVWTNVNITPHSHIDVKIVQWGIQTPVANGLLRVDVVAQGQGRAKLHITNTGGATVTPFTTISFQINYPLSLI